MRNIAYVAISVGCLAAITLGAGGACKKTTPPAPAPVVVALPKQAAPAPPVPEAPAPRPSPVAAPKPNLPAVDGGAVREAGLAPAPFYLLPPRPDCKTPRRALSNDDGPDLALLAAGNSWAFVRPQDLPVKDESAPQEKVVLPSYFDGLPPGRALVVIFSGNDPRARPQGEAVGQPEYQSVKPVWVGPFSDHCLAVRPEDRSILFSVLLADDLALQAVAHYAKKRQRVSENEVGGKYSYYPVLGFELRTVDLKSGKVRDRKLHAANPEAVSHYPIEGVTPMVERLGTAGVVVYPRGFIPRLLFLSRRSGEIPTMHELDSETFGFDVGQDPQAGGWTFRYHERPKSRANEPDSYDKTLHITPELTIEN